MQPRDWLQAGTAMFVGTLLFGMDLLARADIKKSKETLQNTYVEVKMVKVDVQEIKSDLKTIKSDVSTLKSDVSNLKSDLVTTRTDFTNQIQHTCRMARSPFSFFPDPRANHVDTSTDCIMGGGKSCSA